MTTNLSVQLTEGLAAMGIAMSAQQREKLLAYVALLLKWNKTYSLTAIREPERMVAHHLLDSLAPLPYFPDFAERVLDVGSGFGTPGIPLAIAKPEWQLVLLDSNSKKTSFLRQVLLELQLPNVQIVTERVERYAPDFLFQVITSRAFADLSDFIRLTAHLLAPGGQWLALKGVYPYEEIARLPDSAQAKGVDKLMVPGIDAERHLVHVVPS